MRPVGRAGREVLTLICKEVIQKIELIPGTEIKQPLGVGLHML